MIEIEMSNKNIYRYYRTRVGRQSACRLKSDSVCENGMNENIENGRSNYVKLL